VAVLVAGTTEGKEIAGRLTVKTNSGVLTDAVNVIAGEDGAQRRRNGLGAIAPSDHLSYAANLLYMTFGKVPEPQIVAAFETSLILCTEDSVKAARFAATAVSDFYDAVAASLAEFKNAPNAVAGEAVMAMLNEIAIPDNAKPWLQEAQADGRKIPGFSHSFRKPDPRVLSYVPPSA